ncbi:glycosyltransferase [Nocardioides lianchengensis]|uniref:Glycosyl transferases group 1 n=1 Tax=Nocardioides lianchengensis TaxID=1045774 RepID=A0A1G6LVQ4_9ACTN|nr:glycosyltransferase [Nocardioides lianchengensis]NYG12428.1 glycosyltransferase involved in cell wall biosynthesis [Nocardioides lianchengensis]SDC47388.1 Glycosyl transferases group 1 [Nocardioides lianchengensis]
MEKVTFLEDGPRVLSMYDGFFAGGARMLHTAVVRSLEATTSQRHAVLGLSDRVHREATVQLAREDASYRRLRAAGVPVSLLQRAPADPLRPAHLASLERAVAGADVVLSLKEQPLAALARVEVTRPVVTCLHRSDPEHQGPGLETLVSLVERGVVTTAICCARSTQAAYHAATGIPLEQLPVVLNGVDLHRFRPDADQRSAVRRELGVVGDAPVVLLAARFDPMKDVGLFVRSAAVLAARYPDAHLVLCGAGMSPDNRDLTDLLTTGLRRWDGAHRQVHLLGIREDMPRLYNAADLVVLTSAYGEAAPLSLLEGMACGAVPVTTDVGDAAAMVGDRRLVVDRDAASVAAGWEAAFELREEHAERILRQRQRLSDQRCFDAYAAIVAGQVRPEVLELAV